MAITPLVQGVQREIWREFALQGGGVAQVVHTGIRISAPKLACVQGLLSIDTPTGNPVFAAVPYVGAGIYEGLLQVQVENTALGGGANSGMWTLDVRLVQSPSQANRGATGYILVAQGASSGGVLAPQTLAQTYDVGAAPADQTLTLTDAHGGGLLIDASDPAIVGGSPALEIRQSLPNPLPLRISRAGATADGAVFNFWRSRGTFTIPVDNQAGDQMGVVEFAGYVNGGFTLGARIDGTVASVAGNVMHGVLDFWATSPGTQQIARMEAPGAGLATITCYGTTPVVRPLTNNTGSLGQTDHIWLAAHLGNAYLYQASNSASSAILQFRKSRGTLAVPLDVQANDALGLVDFRGYLSGAMQIGAQIIGTVLGSTGMGGLDGALDFYAAQNNVSLQVARMQMDAGLSTVTFYTNPLLWPDVDNTGTLGLASKIWSAAHLGNAYLYHASNDAVSSILQFQKARGTLTVPLAVQANDELGTVDFYGYPVAGYVQSARIVGLCVGAGASYATELDFYVVARGGALYKVMRLNGDGTGADTLVTFYKNPLVYPGADHSGRLGDSSMRWAEINVDDALVYTNVRMGGGAVGGNPHHTVMLPNETGGCAMPVPQADQVYLGSLNFFGVQGSSKACLAISSEEPTIPIGGNIPGFLVPIIFNGEPLYLFAMNDRTE